jgi:hypothetical protein
METRICSKCKIVKELDNFSGEKRYCKECINRYEKEKRQNNEEYRLKVNERQRLYIKKMYEDPLKKSELNKKRREYKKKNPPSEEQKRKSLKYSKKRLQDNPELRKKMNEQSKEWRKKNPERVKEKRNKWICDNYKNNPLYYLRKRISSRTRLFLRRKGLMKSESTESILGCDYETFVKHIESLFKDGMNWDNKDKWHLDHIIPLSSGETIEEINKLGHYTNIQPLWAEDNLKKGNRILLDVSDVGN